VLRVGLFGDMSLSQFSLGVHTSLGVTTKQGKLIFQIFCFLRKY